jgi:hypothetical protein
MASTIGIAQAVLIEEEEHWKYHVDRWTWDSDRRKTIGLMSPQIVIQNETSEGLEGYIADANGTRLAIYDGEQVVQVRFAFDSGMISSWELAGRVHDGYFTINIPEKYKDAQTVRIFIGKNQYNVNNGTPTTPQTEVHINSAIVNYRTNSTLSSQTQIADVPEEQRQPRSIYDGGSLIDWILSQNGIFLSVRSANSSK